MPILIYNINKYIVQQLNVLFPKYKKTKKYRRKTYALMSATI
jgi:hypothetical protein